LSKIACLISILIIPFTEFYKKIQFFYLFSEANPAFRSKLAPQKLFFFGTQRASVGRCCAPRKNSFCVRKAFLFNLG
jgi:hypothetical protein